MGLTDILWRNLRRQNARIFNLNTVIIDSNTYSQIIPFVLTMTKKVDDLLIRFSKDAVKYRLYDAITAALKDCVTWDELRKLLATKGISLDLMIIRILPYVTLKGSSLNSRGSARPTDRVRMVTSTLKGYR